MNEIPTDSDRQNPILDYPGYYMPGFFSWLLGEIPRFGIPDWGPIPQLPRERPVTPPFRNPNLPPAHEVDPPDRPPEWLFGPPRIVQASPVSRQTIAETPSSSHPSSTPLADVIIDRFRQLQQQNARQTQFSAFGPGSASQNQPPIRRLTRVRAG